MDANLMLANTENSHQTTIQELIQQNQLQKAISLLPKLYQQGKPHQSFHFIFNSLVRSIHRLTQPKKSLSLFQKIKLLVSQFPQSRKQHIMLINCIASIYRRVGRFNQAKSQLEVALTLIKNFSDSDIDKASTYLNFCAVQSSLGKHRLAYEYAMLGAQQAQEQLLNIEQIPEQEKDHKINVLAIAYYNTGCQLEHLKRYKESSIWYNKAISFIEKNSDVPNLLQILADCKKNESVVKKQMNSRPASARRPSSATTRKPNFQIQKGNLYRSTQRRLQPIKPQNYAFQVRTPLENKPSTFDEIRQKIKMEEELSRIKIKVGKVPKMPQTSLNPQQRQIVKKDFISLSKIVQKRSTSVPRNLKAKLKRTKLTIQNTEEVNIISQQINDIYTDNEAPSTISEQKQSDFLLLHQEVKRLKYINYIVSIYLGTGELEYYIEAQNTKTHETMKGRIKKENKLDVTTDVKFRVFPNIIVDEEIKIRQPIVVGIRKFQDQEYNVEVYCVEDSVNILLFSEGKEVYQFISDLDILREDWGIQKAEEIVQQVTLDGGEIVIMNKIEQRNRSRSSSSPVQKVVKSISVEDCGEESQEKIDGKSVQEVEQDNQEEVEFREELEFIEEDMKIQDSIIEEIEESKIFQGEEQQKSREGQGNQQSLFQEQEEQKKQNLIQEVFQQEITEKEKLQEEHFKIQNLQSSLDKEQQKPQQENEKQYQNIIFQIPDIQLDQKVRKIQRFYRSYKSRKAKTKNSLLIYKSTHTLLNCTYSVSVYNHSQFLHILASKKHHHLSLFLSLPPSIQKSTLQQTIQSQIIPNLYIKHGKLHSLPQYEQIPQKLYSSLQLYDIPELHLNIPKTRPIYSTSLQFSQRFSCSSPLYLKTPNFHPQMPQLLYQTRQLIQNRFCIITFYIYKNTLLIQVMDSKANELTLQIPVYDKADIQIDSLKKLVQKLSFSEDGKIFLQDKGSIGEIVFEKGVVLSGVFYFLTIYLSVETCIIKAFDPKSAETLILSVQTEELENRDFSNLVDRLLIKSIGGKNVLILQQYHGFHMYIVAVIISVNSYQNYLIRYYVVFSSNYFDLSLIIFSPKL